MDNSIETGEEALPAAENPLGVTPSNDISEEDGCTGNISQLSGSQDVKERWGEASQLLFQPGYLHVLKQMALSGQMQMYNIRSVTWRLFLGCLPEEHSKWEGAVAKSRERYNQLKKKHITDPHIASASLDVAINNPLSQEEDSPWHQFFLDNELRQMINQDVVRTFPDVSFFKQDHIQEAMLDLLFIYCKENPDPGYRQGMHEVLAPILFVLHAEERDHDDITLAPEVQIVMDSDFLEHDGYTIFAELMENIQQWYMSSALEVDYYRTRAQANSNRKMQHDPRTHKPFEQNQAFHSSAISRKLEKIHHVLLKKADEVLYTRLNDLSIPMQTYGIRWIRLLFGREFPLPSVLELWDALFADGPSLDLVDYISVAMLMHIREVLIEGDYAVCMQHLMRFPMVYEVNYLIQRALHIRNPTAYPSPRIWTYHPSRVSKLQPTPPGVVTQLMDEKYSTGTGTSSKARTQNSTEKLADFFQSRARSMPKSMGSHSSRNTARLEFNSRSPSPVRKQTQEDGNETDEQLFSGASSGSGSGKRVPRFKILGDRNKSSKVNSNTGKEMTTNPKTQPVSEASLTEIERLTTRLEDVEAKCLYCGGKLDSVIATLQEEIPEIPNLNPETENSLLLSIAGLKQIRDLLLKKIHFSGDSTLGWDTTYDTRKKKLSGDLSNSDAKEEDIRNEVDLRTDQNLNPLMEGGDSDLKLSEDRDDQAEVSRDSSLEEGSLSSVGDDWVTLSSSSHPLVTNTD